MSTVYLTLFALKVYPSKDPRKTVIITGANRGIGYAAAKILAATGQWKVVLACRNEEEARAAVDSVHVWRENIEFHHLDLADIRSIKEFRSKWGTKSVDCLVLNAGIHTGLTNIPVRTVQGFEATVGINHIGHFYFTQLMMGNLQTSSNGRVVIVGSSGKYCSMPTPSQNVYIFTVFTESLSRSARCQRHCPIERVGDAG